MNSQENTSIVQESYALFGKGDVQNLMNLYADDIEFVFPGPANIPLPGTYRGKEEVLKFLSLLSQHIAYETFELTDFIAQGNKVAVLGHERGKVKETNLPYEVDWVQVFTLKNGLITRLQAFLDTATVAAAFKKGALQKV